MPQWLRAYAALEGDHSSVPTSGTSATSGRSQLPVIPALGRSMPLVFKGIHAHVCIPTHTDLWESANTIKGPLGSVTCPSPGSDTLGSQAGALTGDGGVDSEGPEAGHFLPACLLHPGAEDVLPRIELEQLDAPQHLIGLLQPLIGIFLGAGEVVGVDSELEGRCLWP